MQNGAIRRDSAADYFRLIFLTAWVILFHRSRLYEQVFLDLPQPQSDLLAAPAVMAPRRIATRGGE